MLCSQVLLQPDVEQPSLHGFHDRQRGKHEHGERERRHRLDRLVSCPATATQHVIGQPDIETHQDDPAHDRREGSKSHDQDNLQREVKKNQQVGLQPTAIDRRARNVRRIGRSRKAERNRQQDGEREQAQVIQREDLIHDTECGQVQPARDHGEQEKQVQGGGIGVTPDAVHEDHACHEHVGPVVRNQERREGQSQPDIAPHGEIGITHETAHERPGHVERQDRDDHHSDQRFEDLGHR